MVRKKTLCSDSIGQSNYAETLAPFLKETICKSHGILQTINHLEQRDSIPSFCRPESQKHATDSLWHGIEFLCNHKHKESIQSKYFL